MRLSVWYHLKVHLNGLSVNRPELLQYQGKMSNMSKPPLAVVPILHGSILAGAMATLLVASPAYAACTDTAAAATATAGSTCAAIGSTYTNGTYALESTGAGSSLTVNNAVSLNLSGASATAAGTAVAAADGGGGTLTFNSDVAIVQYGSTNSYGLAAGDVAPSGSGTVLVQGATSVQMNAGGATRRAVLAYQTGSVVTLVGPTTISATGGSSHRGLSAEDGTINYSSANINFAGWGGSTGIRSTTSGSLVHASGDTDITVDTGGSVGVLSVNGAVTTFDGKLTVNAGSGSGAAVQANSTSSVSMGANSLLTNTTGAAVLLAGAPTFTAGSGLTVNGGTDGFSYSGVTASTINLTNATVTAPNLWHAVSSSVATFNGSGGVYAGTSTKDATSTLNVNLSNAAVWNLTADATLTAASLTSSAVLSSPTASRTLTGNLSNTGGTLDLSGATPSAAQVFTVAGDYDGGGAVSIDTQLGDSSSPTDSVVITGDVSGVTTLNVTNVGGTGAATTGNGILMVQISGSSPAGAFVLPGGYVQVGAWRYTLVQVGQNWYLQSQAVPPVVNATPVPTLSTWALVVLSLLLPLLGYRRRV